MNFEKAEFLLSQMMKEGTSWALVKTLKGRPLITPDPNEGDKIIGVVIRRVVRLRRPVHLRGVVHEVALGGYRESILIS